MSTTAVAPAAAPAVAVPAPPAVAAATAGNLLDRARTSELVDAWIAEASANGELEDGVIPDYLEELRELAHVSLREKVERTVAVIGKAARVVATIDGELGFLRAESARLTARKRALENKNERRREWMKACLEVAGETRLEYETFTVRIQKNGGVAPIRYAPTFSLDALGPNYRIVTYEPDTTAIRRALEAGERLAGATLGERGTSLRIA